MEDGSLELFRLVKKSGEHVVRQSGRNRGLDYSGSSFPLFIKMLWLSWPMDCLTVESIWGNVAELYLILANQSCDSSSAPPSNKSKKMT